MGYRRTLARRGNSAEINLRLGPNPKAAWAEISGASQSTHARVASRCACQSDHRRPEAAGLEQTQEPGLVTITPRSGLRRWFQVLTAMRSYACGTATSGTWPVAMTAAQVAACSSQHCC